MTQRELLDQTLMFLYSRQDGVIGFQSIVAIEKDMMTAVRLLNTIYDCGFSTKEINKTPSVSHGQNIYIYSINSKGVDFIESLPTDFSDKPYSYYLKLDADKQKIKNERDEIDYKLKQITLSSIPTNKTIAIWAVFVAIIAVLAPIVVFYINKDNPTKTELISPDLNKIQQTQEQELQMLKDVLDSLRKM